LDEPTNGLDPEGTVEVRNLIRELPKRGATALVCTHRLAEVEAMCDYVVVLDKGRLLTRGTLDEVIASATGGGHLIEVAASDLEAATRALSGLELGDLVVEDGVIRTSRSAPDASVITRTLAEKDIYLRGLRTERPSLEDAFLKIVADAQES
jgi:ABC-2 type transport system ATP-binding protein